MRPPGSQEKSLPSIISHPDEENRASALSLMENAAEKCELNRLAARQAKLAA
jgi:hypothetical protein